MTPNDFVPIEKVSVQVETTGRWIKQTQPDGTVIEGEEATLRYQDGRTIMVIIREITSADPEWPTKDTP